MLSTLICFSVTGYYAERAVDRAGYLCVTVRNIFDRAGNCTSFYRICTMFRTDIAGDRAGYGFIVEIFDLGASRRFITCSYDLAVIFIIYRFFGRKCS